MDFESGTIFFLDPERVDTKTNFYSGLASFSLRFPLACYLKKSDFPL